MAKTERENWCGGYNFGVDTYRFFTPLLSNEAWNVNFQTHHYDEEWSALGAHIITFLRRLLSICKLNFVFQNTGSNFFPAHFWTRHGYRQKSPADSRLRLWVAPQERDKLETVRKVIWEIDDKPSSFEFGNDWSGISYICRQRGENRARILYNISAYFCSRFYITIQNVQSRCEDVRLPKFITARLEIWACLGVLYHKAETVVMWNVSVVLPP